MRTASENVIERNLNRRRTDRKNFSFFTTSLSKYHHIRSIKENGGSAPKIGGQDTFDPVQHSSFYQERTVEVPGPQVNKNYERGASLVKDIDKPAEDNQEILLSRAEMQPILSNFELKEKEESLHDKMANLMYKTLNNIEEEHANRNHRKASMAQADKETVNSKAKTLLIALQQFSEEQRVEKAARHFEDALHLRAVRNDIDINTNKFLVWCYRFQTNPKWQETLYWLSWLYMFLIVFEPDHSGQDHYYENRSVQFRALVGLESAILFIFAWELFMDIFHRTSDTVKTFKMKYIRNCKVLIKGILVLIFVCDAIVFYSYLPDSTFRFGRVFRPCCLALYHKQLRRTVVGLIRSVMNMIDILLFFLVICVVYAFLGSLAIGDLNHEVHYDKLLDNFSDFPVTLNNMYLFLSRENYPEIMLPAFHASPIYILYFIPFLLLDILLLVPIPIAVMFDAFRGNRAKLYVKDTIKERDALCASFICLDSNVTSTIGYEMLVKLLKSCGYRADETTFKNFFNVLDAEGKGMISLDNFMGIVEAMEEHRHFFLKPKRIPKVFNLPRKLINKIFKFNKIVKFRIFSLVFIVFGLIHAALLISSVFIHNHESLNTIDDINTAFVWTYVGEIVICLVGMGFRPYLRSKSNKVDFFLTVITVLPNIFNITNHERRFIRSLSIFRVLKVIRLVKMFKLKEIKPKSIVWRIYRLFGTLVICFPIALKLAVIIFMLMYVYAIIGMEIYPSSSALTLESRYIADLYYSFDNIGSALLTLFQVMNQAMWTMLELDYADRYGSLGRAAAFFNSFHAFASLILISLLTGLIWEIFDFVNKEEEDEEEIETIKEETENKLSHMDSVSSPLKPHHNRQSSEEIHLKITKSHQNLEFSTLTPVDKKKFISQHVIPQIIRPPESERENIASKRINLEGTIFFNPAKEEVFRTFQEDDDICELTLKPEARGSETKGSASDKVAIRLLVQPGDQDLVPSFDSIDEVGSVHSKQKSLGTYVSSRTKSSVRSIVPSAVVEGPDDIESRFERDFYKKKVQIFICKVPENENILLQFSPGKELSTRTRAFSFRNDEIVPNSPQLRSAERSPKDRMSGSLSPRRKKGQLKEDKIIGKALVTGAAKEKIQKYQEERMKDASGTWFNTAAFAKLDNLAPIFSAENRITVKLLRGLREPSRFASDFLEYVTSIENLINTELIGKGGLNKFIFGDIKGNWFFPGSNPEGIELYSLKKGLWNYFTHVFPDKTKLYESKDILFYRGKSEVIKESLERVHGSFCSISRYVEGSLFRKCHKEDYIWNFYAVPFEYTDTLKLRNIMVKKWKDNSGLDLASLQEKLVYRGIYFVVNMIGKPDPNDNGIRDARRKSQLNELLSPKRKQSVDVPIKNPPLKKNSSKNGSLKNLTQGAFDEENAVLLPNDEMAEFLMDVKDIIQVNTENILEKMTECYATKRVDTGKKKNS